MPIIVRDNNKFESFFHLGLNAAKNKKFTEAVNYFEKSIELNPESVESLINLAASYSEIGKNFEAEQSLMLALEKRPNNEDILINLAKVLQFQKKYQRVAECFYSLTSIYPLSKKTWQNFGEFLKVVGKYEQSIKCFKKVISIDDSDLEAHLSLCNLYKSIRNYEEVIKTYESLKVIDPNLPFLEGYLFHYKMMVCDWYEYDKHVKTIKEGINNSLPVAEPFGSQAFLLCEEELFKVAKIFCSKTYPSQNLSLQKNRQKNKKIKIAYLSGEWRYQATSILLIGLIENHDKSLFEVIALDNGYDDGSELRLRLNKAFDSIIDISNKSDYEVAELIKFNNIDILVNLNGYFGLGRQNVFAMRPAPVQVNFLGFPGTIGADYIDYIIADKITIPDQSKKYYAEKVIYLERPYQCNDNKRDKPKERFSRKDLGLPSDAFVYCCFNNNYKITPVIFDSWLEILNQVPNSIIWLIEDNKSASDNLKNYAKRKNFDYSRLIFAPRFEISEHLSRHKCADLFLDTTPYNAHTTASDALWAGLPILTLRGTTFPGRVCESLLNSLGLQELVVDNYDEYVKKAVYIANNRVYLEKIKSKLNSELSVSKLFDTRGYAHEYELLLKKIAIPLY